SFISCWSSSRTGSTPFMVVPHSSCPSMPSGYPPGKRYPSGIREGAMDLAFLHPLYEHPGPWASVYVDTSSHTESTPHARSLVAAAVSRELAAQGADEPTRAAVHRAGDELRDSPEPHGRAFSPRT